MNTIRIMKEISKEWQEIMEIADDMPYGKLVIRVDNKQVSLIEYTVQKKPGDANKFKVRPLSEE